jgi:hypothetical protein
MDAELRIDLHEQMNVVGYHFQLDQLRMGLGNDFSDDRLEPGINALDEDGTAVFEAPNDVVLARVDEVSVALVLHTLIIQSLVVNQSDISKKPHDSSPCLKAGAFSLALVTPSEEVHGHERLAPGREGRPHDRSDHAARQHCRDRLPLRPRRGR